MKLIPYNIDYLRNNKPGKNEAILKEFLNSGQKCVKVEGYPHKNARSFATTFWKSARAYGITNVSVRTHGDEVFLIRTDL